MQFKLYLTLIDKEEKYKAYLTKNKKKSFILIK